MSHPDDIGDDNDARYHQPVVYFIQADYGGPVKIGWTVSPLERLAALQTASPRRLVIRAVIPGDRALERKMHKTFAAFRLHGEWFAPCPLMVKVGHVLCDGEPDRGESEGTVLIEDWHQPPLSVRLAFQQEPCPAAERWADVARDNERERDVRKRRAAEFKQRERERIRARIAARHAANRVD